MTLSFQVPKAARTAWKALFMSLTGKVSIAAMEKDYLIAHQSSVIKEAGLVPLESFAPPQR